MMAQLLSLPACWGKIAQVSEDRGNVSERSQGIIFKEIVSSLKTAGMNPFEIQGFLLGLVEASPKIAEMEKVAVPTPPAVTTAQPPPATTPATENNIHLGLDGKTLKDWGNKAVAVIGDTFGFGNTKVVQDASRKVLDSEAQKASPLGYQFAEMLFPEQESRTLFLDNLRQGNWLKAIGQGGEALAANPTVKKWAPYIVPAAATMAATRLAGGTWGQGALLGAGAGAAYGGYLAPNGGMVKGVKKLFSDHPFDDGTSPTANAVIGDSKVPNAGANQAQQTGAEKIQQAGRENAQDILKTMAPAK